MPSIKISAPFPGYPDGYFTHWHVSAIALLEDMEVRRLHVQTFTPPRRRIPAWRGPAWRGQTEFQVNLKLGLTPRSPARSPALRPTPRLSTWKSIPPGECRLGRDIHGFLPRYPSVVNLVAVTFSPLCHLFTSADLQEKNAKKDGAALL